MTTPFLHQDIEREEGLKTEAYPDPLTQAAPWTIGVGHTGPEVEEGLSWSEDQCRAVLNDDIERVVQGIGESSAADVFAALDDVRKDVLVQMGFQMGVHGLCGFHGTLDALGDQDWDTAADHMLDSAWARQTPHRAQRMAQQIRTGVRAWQDQDQGETV
jgi:lysozyme